MTIKSLIASVLLVCMGYVATAQAYVQVSGEVSKTLKLYEADIAKMNKVSVTLSDKDGKDHSYTGVPVLDILNSAGVTTGKQLHGENLTKYVLVKCADGYQVLFALAEMDTALSKKTIILATQADNKPLPEGKGQWNLL
ncbi:MULTISPECIES: molybdopterin-dependent oxidoreductase [Niastella]|uniref:Molybdopterin-dependent oxidoreductase n=1 Tax=Niastella soli TaxID=2821487 RepID=A0ABS3YVR7_9BACT|nr:molybdopterin-dependent oxidoreductase [Niastella soli]MBO9202005.1 molybdopterin-dependent oxidoreductase [Niastella soli]